ncbi:MAG: SPASM domain-containing protein, partial [Clostridia bacterium]|nr:SPASM domain-containing protein [Clostridia bacterium]
QTVEYARGLEKEHNKNFRFTITTNGLWLNDEITQYINREMSNVVLSLDGRKGVHDNVRNTVSGQGTYDIIVPKMQHVIRLRDENKDYYVRGTFTKENLDFTQDIKEMVSLGFRNLSIEPVVLPNESPLAIGPDDLPRIFKEYETLCEYLLENQNTENEFLFFHFMIDLEQGPCIIKRMRGCGAGFEYVAITPEGDIYPCWAYLEEGKPLGNARDGLRNVIFEYVWGNRRYEYCVDNSAKCKDCDVRYLCGGVCHAYRDSDCSALRKYYLSLLEADGIG